MQYNLQIQQELPWQLVAKVGYVGNLGRQLDYTYNANQPDPGPETRRLGGRCDSLRRTWSMDLHDERWTFGISLAAGDHGEALLLRSVSFLTAYTWAHSIDNILLPMRSGARQTVPSRRTSDTVTTTGATTGFAYRHRFTHS